jgi:hypothetical protein
MPKNLHWVGTWTAAPAPAEAGAISNQTLRMDPRVSIGGDRVRVRISNAYGVRPLLVGAARLRLRDKGPAVMPDSHKKLTFGEWFFVSGVDVLASSDNGAVVTLGDSLTDANTSTMDAVCR